MNQSWTIEYEQGDGKILAESAPGKVSLDPAWAKIIDPEVGVVVLAVPIQRVVSVTLDEEL
jgi:hypothetical protein